MGTGVEGQKGEGGMMLPMMPQFLLADMQKAQPGREWYYHSGGSASNWNFAELRDLAIH